MTHRLLVAGVVAVLGVIVLAGCGSRVIGGSPSSGWVDQPVTFQAGGMTIYGTYHHPEGRRSPVPAALLIAGSGPTDRDGNSMLIKGTVGTLSTLADWLAADGVASLRYDKLGTGQTGIGPYAGGRPIDLIPYEQEAAAALNYLAGQPGVNRSRLMVLGHSEGALFALLLATGATGPTPPVTALGLIEPASQRAMDQISEQVTASVTHAEQAGAITRAQANDELVVLANTIATARESGTVPPNLPKDLTPLFNPSSITFLRQLDRYDPAHLAGTLTTNLPVLVSCSTADVQISCADVDHLTGGLAQAHTDTDLVHLTGVDHILKQDPSGTSANYAAPLPFSTQLEQALHDFAAQHLTN
jgi:alpha-beta hydrolase superfamily lysophospholipase